MDYLNWELTERCNNYCTHCWIRKHLSDPAEKQELTGSEARSIILEAKALGCKGIRFTGGEPLAHPDFCEIHTCAVQEGMAVTVSTNANLITPQIAGFFLEHPPEEIHISIYGWDDGSYEKTTCNPGSFKQFLRGIELLRKRGIKFTMRYPPLRELVKNREKLQVLAKELGAEEEMPYPWELTLHARCEPEACNRIRKVRLN